MQSPRDILDTGPLPNPLQDARWVEAYAREGGDPADLIYLSLGETWTQVAPGLARTLRDRVPAHAHGYTLSPYGLPALRETLHAYITRTHHLDSGALAPYEVAVSQSGTRATMADFARLWATAPGPDSRLTALVPEPGWDYASLLRPLGYHVRVYRLDRAHDWQPDPAAVDAALRETAASGRSLLVLNTQHNPTAVDWRPGPVGAAVRSAREHGAALLVDDAYYGLHTPGVPPTNTLRILLENHAGAPSDQAPWLAVRTLGKQFHCNGWGIGAMTASAATLAALADIVHQRSYGCALPLQAAMAYWLRDPEADTCLEGLRVATSAARDHATRRLTTDLGFPPEAVVPGTCTSYLRLQVPPHHVGPDGSEDPYRLLALRAGVLAGRGSMTGTKRASGCRKDTAARDAWIRLYLGHPSDVLDRALNRLTQAGLGWSAESGAHTTDR